MFFVPYFGSLVPGLVQGVTTGGNPGTNFKAQTIQSDALRFNSNYGRGVALLGNEMFVGEPGAVGSIFAVGEVHYYTRATANDNFVRQSGFFADTQQNGGEFGTWIAYDGTTVAVGSPNPSPGNVWVYTDQGSTFDEQIQPNDTTNTGAVFGESLDIVGAHMLIGAKGYNNGGSNRGGVEYWENVAGTWTHRQTFQSGTAVNNILFGAGVAMTDDSTAFIGRFGNESGSLTFSSFTVEKWVRSGTTWSADAEWQGSHGTNEMSNSFPLATDGTNLIVGITRFDDPETDCGLVEIYQQNGSLIDSTGILLTTVPGDTTGNQLGGGVAIDGDEAVIGEPFADPDGTSGAGTATLWKLDAL